LASLLLINTYEANSWEVIMKKLSISILLLVVCIGLVAAINGKLNVTVNAVRDGSPEGPYNLEAELIGNDVIILFWDNPTYTNLPFEFNVYCNNNCVRHIPGANVADCTLEDVCAGCHQFYVTACFDSGCESDPSNIVEVTITGLNDENIAGPGLELKVYPNPSRGDVNIALSGAKFGENEIAVFNIRGQKLRQIEIGSGQTGLWDGRDAQGRKVSEGIYYLKAITTQGSVTQKIILVR
jgi:hypothetical protein